MSHLTTSPSVSSECCHHTDCGKKAMVLSFKRPVLTLQGTQGTKRLMAKQAPEHNRTDELWLPAATLQGGHHQRRIRGTGGLRRSVEMAQAPCR